MRKSILAPDVQDFIKHNCSKNPSVVALGKNPFPAIPLAEIAAQIEAKSKARVKLPTWFNQSSIYYPSKVALEQTSSEITARYKATLVNGNRLIDLTGGFGVDAYFFSQQVAHVIHCEINTDLAAIAAHNFAQLGAKNITCLEGNSLELLHQINLPIEWIYLDPSRRNSYQKKVFKLTDCEPNVPLLLSDYFQYADHILIKTSPLVDLTQGLNELNSVTAIHIVAVQQEVKEILWVLTKGFIGNPQVNTVHFVGDEKQHFDFLWKQAESTYSTVLEYLYEPNAAIMKSGGFGALSMAFNLPALHKHTHLYTSDQLVNFPGRSFRVNEVIPYNKAGIKTVSALKKANISVRNFPESVATIRKKTKLIDGGSHYLFFATGLSGTKIILICSKI